MRHNTAVTDIRDLGQLRDNMRRVLVVEVMQWARGEVDGDGPGKDIAELVLEFRDQVRARADAADRSVRDVVDAFVDDAVVAAAVALLWRRYQRAETALRNSIQRVAVLETQMGQAQTAYQNLNARVTALEQADQPEASSGDKPQ